MAKKNRGWARAITREAHIMRQGAWYEVVGGSSDPELIVLDIARRNVAVRRDSVEIAKKRPTKFSVVYPTPADDSGNTEGLALPYAVCPSCCARVDVSEQPHKIKCPTCLHSGKVAWDEIPAAPRPS